MKLPNWASLPSICSSFFNVTFMLSPKGTGSPHQPIPARALLGTLPLRHSLCLPFLCPDSSPPSPAETFFYLNPRWEQYQGPESLDTRAHHTTWNDTRFRRYLEYFNSELELWPQFLYDLQTQGPGWTEQEAWEALCLLSYEAKLAANSPLPADPLNGLRFLGLSVPISREIKRGHWKEHPPFSKKEKSNMKYIKAIDKKRVIEWSLCT